MPKGAASAFKRNENGAGTAARKAPTLASVAVEQQGSISAEGTASL
jgi:hypothetical protein